jgi:hypothetical protein
MLRISAITRLVGVLFATTLAGSMSGCEMSMAGVLIAGAILAPAAVVQSASEYSRQQAIGDQSIPANVPEAGPLRLVAYPLNATARQGHKPFVICLVAQVLDGTATTLPPPTATLDPSRILLILPGPASVRPSGYALPARCPYPDLPDLAGTDLAFHEIDFTQALAWKRESAEPVTELALRFDIATPDPSQTFSLDLGSLTLNRAEYLLPRIGFTRTRGAILRASGEAAPRPANEHDQYVNCVSGGRRVWTYRSRCD